MINMASFMFLIVVLIHLVFTINVENEAEEDYTVIEVPLQPKYIDSDEKSIISDTDKSHRGPRHSSSCSIPQELENSNLTCVLYPSKVKCIQTCMFGHTFSEGIRRTMVCDRIWNKWTPIPEFENCDPFIDCGVTLRSGGKIKCVSNFMDRGAECELSCHHYEDKPAIPTKIYKCNIDGSWTPELPFCVLAGSGLPLVPPPRR